MKLHYIDTSSIFLVLSIITFKSGIDFKENNHTKGIVLEKLSDVRVYYDTYSLIYHIDLNSFYNTTENISTNLKIFKSQCNRVKTKKCMIFLSQLEKKFKKLAKAQSALQIYQPSKRVKRVIPLIIGYALCVAISTAISAGITYLAVNDLAANVNQTQNEVLRLNDLIYENTYLINQSIDFQKNITHDLEHRIHNLNKRLDTALLSSESNHIDSIFKSYSEHINCQVFDQIQRAFQIEKHLEGALNGKLTQLIPEQKLRNGLIFIKTQLKQSQTLPLDLDNDSSLYIFKSSTIKGAIFNKLLLLELQFPVPEKDIFIAYEIIPLPIKIL